MALIEVKVPQLSESVAEATLLQWHKKPGDAIERDDNLIDVETDKGLRRLLPPRPLYQRLPLPLRPAVLMQASRCLLPPRCWLRQVCRLRMWPVPAVMAG